MVDTVNVSITATTTPKANITRVDLFDAKGNTFTYQDGAGWSGAPAYQIGTVFTVRSYVKNEGSTGTITVMLRNITGSQTLATYTPTISTGATATVDYVHTMGTATFSLGIYANP